MTTTYPGDDVIPDAAMVYDRKYVIKASPEAIWPWLVQLGKGRGGWYLTRTWEWVFPKSWRASRIINPEWQNLKPGDRVEDYGFGKEEFFNVVSISPPSSLVYVSERLGTIFTWALLLHSQSQDTTEVHLRFRGRLQSTGWQRRLLIAGGDWMDWIFTVPMVRGLAERVERPHQQ